MSEEQARERERIAAEVFAEGERVFNMDRNIGDALMCVARWIRTGSWKSPPGSSCD